MAKNTEWGAVAYLSQSIYGKYGNTSYTGANKKVYKNDSSDMYTGRSGGTYLPNRSSTDGACLYNDITDRGSGIGSCGGGASTTGNITGIYDMYGGTFEYVMGYLTTSTSALSDTGFTSAPASKYYDAYTSNNPLIACNGGICYGHALNETGGWYDDIKFFVSASDPWFNRGDNYGSDTFSGVFYSNIGNGNANDYISFRSVFLTPGA